MDDLERKIIRVQKSTRTTLPGFAKIHNNLRARFKWYYFWHTLPQSRIVHLGILALVLLVVLSSTTIFIFNALTGKTSAASSTKPAGTGADDATVGTVAWSSPTNVYTDNATYASASGASNALTHYLKATNFGFAIPSDATINGVQVKFNRHSTKGTGTGVVDNTIKLVKGGVVSGNNKSTSTVWQLTNDRDDTFGGTSDLWGVALTPADVNASNFGVVLAVNLQDPSETIAWLDYVEITITYTIATPAITSPNGTENWPINTSQTVTWSTSATNQVEAQNLSLYDNFNDNSIDTNIWSATASPSNGITTAETGGEAKISGTASANNTSAFDLANASALSSPAAFDAYVKFKASTNPAGTSVYSFHIMNQDNTRAIRLEYNGTTWGFYAYDGAVWTTVSSGISVGGETSSYLTLKLIYNPTTNKHSAFIYSSSGQEYFIGQMTTAIDLTVGGTKTIKVKLRNYTASGQTTDVRFDNFMLVPTNSTNLYNFDSQADGENPTGWTLGGDGTYGDIEVDSAQSVSASNSLLFNHSVSNGSLTARPADLATAMGGVVYGEADMRRSSTGNTNTSDFRLQNSGGTNKTIIRFGSDSNIYVFNGASPTNVRAYAINTWYHIFVILDVERQKYTVYIDGVLEASDFDVFSTSGDKTISRILLTSEGNVSGATSTWFDNVQTWQEFKTISSLSAAGTSVSWDTTGWSAGTKYLARARTFSDSAWGAWDYSDGLFTLYGVPNTPSISSPTDGQIDVSVNPTITSSAFSGSGSHTVSDWEIYDDAAMGGTDRVWYKNDDAANLTSITANAANGTFENGLAGQTKLANSTQYWVRVRHANAAGDSSWSSSTHDFTTEAPEPPPSAPTNVTVDTIAQTTAVSHWTDNASDETGYKVWVSTASANPCSGATYSVAPDYTPAANATSQNLSSLTPAKSYCVKVVATRDGTDSDPGYSAVFHALPNTPGAPTVNATSSTALTIIIDVNSNDTSAQYAISCDNDATFLNYTSNACEAIVNDSDHWRSYSDWGGASGFADTGLDINSSHTYKVKARNNNGTPDESSLSASASKYTLANTPSAPTVSNVGGTDTDRLNIVINPNSNPASVDYAFGIDQDSNGSIDAGGWVQADGTLGASAVWQDRATWGGDGGVNNTGLSVNTNYIYKVKARNDDTPQAETALSPSDQQYTRIQVPSGITIGTVTDTSIAMSASGSLSNLNSGSSGLQFAETTTHSGYGAQTGFANAAPPNDWTQTNSVDDTGLAEGTQYCYNVKARNGDGLETAVTSPDVCQNTTAPGPPAAPSGVNLTTDSTTQLTAHWTDNSGDEDGFKVYVSTVSNADCSLATYPGSPDYTTAANATSRALPGLSINSPYCTKIIAYRGATDSDPAYAASPKYTLANAPGSSTLTGASATSVNLVIGQNSNPASTNYAFGIDLDDNGSVDANSWVQGDGTLGAAAAWQSYTVWGGASGTNILGLSVNTNYQFIVEARNGDSAITAFNSGDWKYTLANTPGAPTVENVGSSTSQLKITVDKNGNPESTTDEETLRPNAAGDLTEFSMVEPVGSVHYTVVDEDPTNDNDYILSPGAGLSQEDLFNLPAPTDIKAGDTINSVTVYFRGASPENEHNYARDAAATIKENGTDTTGTYHTLPVKPEGNFTTFSQTWATRPSDNGTWTYSDIQNLQIGVRSSNSAYGGAMVSQVYVVVNYSIGNDTQYAVQRQQTDPNVPANTCWLDTDNSCDVTENWHTYSEWGGASGYTNTGLSTNTEYTYSVKARNGDNVETAFSPSSSRFTYIESATTITFGTINDNDIEMSATGSFRNLSSGSSGLLFRETTGHAGGGGGPGFDTPTQTNSVTDSGLSAATEYCYQVYAQNGDGVASTTWVPASPSCQTTTNSLAQPTAVTIDTMTTTGFTVHWTDNAQGEDSYQVYISTVVANNDCDDAGTLYPASADYSTAANATSQIVTDKQVNTQYCAKVAAKHGASEGTPGYPDPKYTLANAPGTPTVTALSTTSLNVKLDRNGNPAISPMATGTYVGNIVDDRQITGLGFTPDLVLIKTRSADYAALRTSAMVGDVTLLPTVGLGSTNNHIQSLISDGFTIGTNARVNGLGRTYDWVAFGNAGSTNFQVGKYTGTGVDNRNITGLGFTPDIVGIKRDGGTTGRWRVSANVGDQAMEFGGNNDAADHIQSFISDGFQVGSAENANGSDYYWFAFKDTNGLIDENSYSGTGVDDRNITGVGFQPDMVWVRKSVSGTGVVRTSTLEGDLSSFFDMAASAADHIQALQSDGFQVGTSINVNGAGSTYRYGAWKETSGFATEYAIACDNSGTTWLSADGSSCGGGKVWQTHDQWGNTSGINLTGRDINTQYTFSAIAKNGDGVETTLSGSASKYTFANTPGAPTISLPADPNNHDTLNVVVNKNSNPEGPAPADDTDFAIYNQDLAQWVGADGIADEASPVWRTYSTWGGIGGAGNSSLLSDTRYTYSLRARNGDDIETADSGTTNLYTQAEQPGYANFAAHDGSITSLDVEVDKKGNPTGEVADPGLQNDTTYAIYNQTAGKWLGVDGVSDENSESWATYSGWGGASGLVATGLSGANVRYTYQIKARNGNSIETDSYSDSKYTHIEIPTGIDFDDVQTDSLTISANTDFSNLASGSSRVVFDYVSSPTGGNGGTDSGDYHANSYIDEGLDANDRYCYTVRAYNGDNVPSTAAAVPDPEACRYTLALAPNNQSAAGDYTEGDGYLTDVDWGLNGASKVQVYREGNKVYEGAAASYEETLLNPNTLYSYTLYSLNGDDVQNPSGVPVADWTPPDKPINLNTTDITTHSAKNLWDTVLAAGDYEICYGLQPDGSDMNDCTNSIADIFYDKGGLTSGTTYYYKVRTSNANGTGSWSHGTGEWSTPPPYPNFTTSAASQLLVRLPGQNFVNGTGITGVADDQHAGSQFSVTVYAVDNNNFLDNNRNGETQITSSDAQATLPANANLVNGQRAFNVTLRTLGLQTVTGTYLLGGLAPGSQIVNVLAGDPSAQSFVTVDPETLPINNTSTITVYLRDSFNNKLPGYTITITSSNGSDDIQYLNRVTDADGKAVAYITSSVAHTSTLSFRANAIDLPHHPTVTWTTSSDDYNLTARISGPTRIVIQTNGLFSGRGSSGDINRYAWQISDAYYNPNDRQFTNIVTPTPVNQTPTDNTDTVTWTGGDSGNVTETPGNAVTAPANDTNLTTNIPVTKIDQNSLENPDALSKQAEQIANRQKSLPVRAIEKVSDFVKTVVDKTSGWVKDLLGEKGNQDKQNNGNNNQKTNQKKSVFNIVSKALAIESREGVDVNYSFSEMGYHDLSLTVYDSSSTDTAYHQVLVVPPPPVITDIKREGDYVVVYGTAWPDINVDLYFNPSLNSGVKGRTRSSSLGYWHYSVLASEFSVGDYVIYGIAIDDHDIASDPSNEVKFKITLNGDVVVVTPLPNDKKMSTINFIKVLSAILSSLALIGSLGSLLLGINFFNILPYLYYLFTMLMEKLGLIKRREPWGIVYDSRSKAPVELAIVRIFDVKTRKLIETRVTGKDGKFGFLVRPGMYKITITKHGYRFASQFVKEGARTDDIYSNLYHGAAFSITPEKRLVNYNVPIDPLAQEETEKSSIWKRIFNFLILSRVYVKKFIIPLLIIAIAVAVFTYFATEEVINIFVAVLMLLLLIWEIYDRLQKKSWGVVYDSDTKQPIQAALVKIYDEEYHRLKETQATDDLGRFGFVVREGKYSLEVEKEGYRFPSTKVRSKNDGKYHFLYHGEIVAKKKTDTIISTNIPLDKKE